MQEAAAITEEAALSNDDLFTKIRFSWKPEDRAIRDRIRIAGDAAFEEAFADAIAVLDNFFMALRVPEQRDVGNQRVVVRDAAGRTVWQKNEAGQIIERWDQLTGQDVEYTLAKLLELRMVLAPQVNQLMLDALFARHAAQDVADEAWSGVMVGTQGDKQAKANRESRVERYHFFFRYCVYSNAKAFLDEVEGFTKFLNNVRYWGVQGQRNG